MRTPRSFLVSLELFLFAASTLVSTAEANPQSSDAPLAPYVLSQSTTGQRFYDDFDWEAIDDPTHGRVTYVDKPTSIRQNLTYASSDTFVLRTDYKTVVSPSARRGRDSVRIASKRQFSTHVAVFDVRHMPEGCGTWPAIWETAVGPGWPSSGEVDIVEGINNRAYNQATLHTLKGCTMPQDRTETGTPKVLDCASDTGCGVVYPSSPSSPPSFGPGFNAAGGGWFAVERTEEDIKSWFWPRRTGAGLTGSSSASSRVPSDVKSPGRGVDPGSWGVPVVHFPNTKCDFRKYFKKNNIIINLTLCGDWAGTPSQYTKEAGCPSTCNDYVDQNPSDLQNAYFDIGYVRVYEPRVRPHKGGFGGHKVGARRPPGVGASVGL